VNDTAPGISNQGSREEPLGALLGRSIGMLQASDKDKVFIILKRASLLLRKVNYSCKKTYGSCPLSLTDHSVSLTDYLDFCFSKNPSFPHSGPK
jgi:hypothetical protein